VAVQLAELEPVPTAPVASPERFAALAPAPAPMPVPASSLPLMSLDPSQTEGVSVEPARVTVEIPQLEAPVLDIVRIPTGEVEVVEAPPVMQAVVNYTMPPRTATLPGLQSVMVAAELSAPLRVHATATAATAAPRAAVAVSTTSGVGLAEGDVEQMFRSSRPMSSRPGMVLAALVGAIAVLLVVAFVLATQTDSPAAAKAESPAPVAVPAPPTAAAVAPTPEAPAPEALAAPAPAVPAAPAEVAKKVDDDLEPLARAAPVVAKKAPKAAVRQTRAAAPHAEAARVAPAAPTAKADAPEAAAKAAAKPAAAEHDFSFLETTEPAAPASTELKRPQQF
jgi:hypothetical protein